MPAKPIYVEIPIRTSLEELWKRTQEPSLHERWDLRFTRIEYLPRPDLSEPQRFLYATRMGLGLEIRGEGAFVVTKDAPDGSRTAALRFWSDDPRALIRTGGGYWRYVPTPDGVRFSTRYDYETRFGVLGRTFDRTVFRPLLGWATAWSFTGCGSGSSTTSHPNELFDGCCRAPPAACESQARDVDQRARARRSNGSTKGRSGSAFRCGSPARSSAIAVRSRSSSRRASLARCLST